MGNNLLKQKKKVKNIHPLNLWKNGDLARLTPFLGKEFLKYDDKDYRKTAIIVYHLSISVSKT
jgi:hypothetical protein